jgi:hypothetical protein
MTRESGASIIDRLRAKGADVRYHDPSLRKCTLMMRIPWAAARLAIHIVE